MMIRVMRVALFKKSAQPRVSASRHFQLEFYKFFIIKLKNSLMKTNETFSIFQELIII